MSQQQNPQEQQKGQYKCGQCGQPFTTQNELKLHQEERHGRSAGGRDKKNEPPRTQGAGSGSKES